MCTHHHYLQIFGASPSQMLDWATHYIKRGVRIAFFKGQEIDEKGKPQPKPFWDALPKDAHGKTIFWVNASRQFVAHMLDLGADGMKVNASDLAKSQFLKNLGVSLIGQGVRLAPIGANKKAFWKCIKPVIRTRKDGTTYETYSGALDAHWEAGPTTVDQLVWWIDSGAPALAALCGELSDNLNIFDIDVRRFLDKFLEQDGVLEILTRHNVPAMETGKKGFHLWFKVDGEVPPNTKYAYAPDPTAKEGRTVAIESRGPKRGYGLTPHSLHPCGTYYRKIDLFGGSFDHIPTISVAELRILEAAARATCEAPNPIKSDGAQPAMSGKHTRQATTRTTPTTRTSTKGQKLSEIRQEEVRAQADEAQSYIDHALDQAHQSGAYEGRRDVITVINEVLDVARVLERYGYMKESADRYSHPDAYSGGGVSIKNNRSIHHSTNDRLYYDNELTGQHNPIGVYRTRTPFDVICSYSFNGNRSQAVKELAVKLGMAYQGRLNDAPIEPSLSPAELRCVPTEADAIGAIYCDDAPPYYDDAPPYYDEVGSFDPFAKEDGIDEQGPQPSPPTYEQAPNDQPENTIGLNLDRTVELLTPTKKPIWRGLDVSETFKYCQSRFDNGPDGACQNPDCMGECGYITDRIVIKNKVTGVISVALGRGQTLLAGKVYVAKNVTRNGEAIWPNEPIGEAHGHYFVDPDTDMVPSWHYQLCESADGVTVYVPAELKPEAEAEAEPEPESEPEPEPEPEAEPEAEPQKKLYPTLLLCGDDCLIRVNELVYVENRLHLIARKPTSAEALEHYFGRNDFVVDPDCYAVSGTYYFTYKTLFRDREIAVSVPLDQWAPLNMLGDEQEPLSSLDIFGDEVGEVSPTPPQPFVITHYDPTYDVVTPENNLQIDPHNDKRQEIGYFYQEISDGFIPMSGDEVLAFGSPVYWSLLVAPTGSGKTYMVCKRTKAKRVLVVPSISLCEQIHKQHGVPRLHSDMDGVETLEGSNIYVVTYDSLKALSNWLIGRGNDLYDWALFVDEAHHLTLSRVFRHKGLKKFLEAVELFGRVVGMTATPLPNQMFTLFASYKVNTIKFVATRYTVPVYYTNNRDYVGVCKDAHARHKGHHLNIIHANDKTVGAILAKEMIKEGENHTILFNADTKKQSHHIAIVDRSQLNEGVKNVIVTNSWNDGISVIPNYDSYSLIITHHSRLIPEEIEQIASRIRNSLRFLAPSEIIIAKLEGKDKDGNQKPANLSVVACNIERERDEIMTEMTIVLNGLEQMRLNLLDHGITEKARALRNIEKATALDGIKSTGSYRDPYTFDFTAIDARVATAYRYGFSTGGLIDQMIKSASRFIYEFKGEYLPPNDAEREARVKAERKDTNRTKKEIRKATYESVVTSTVGELATPSEEVEEYNRTVSDVIEKVSAVAQNGESDVALAEVMGFLSNINESNRIEAATLAASALHQIANSESGEASQEIKRAAEDLSNMVRRAKVEKQMREKNAVDALGEIINYHNGHDKNKVECAAGIMSIYRLGVTLDSALALVEELGCLSFGKMKKARDAVIFDQPELAGDSIEVKLRGDIRALVWVRKTVQIGDVLTASYQEWIRQGMLAHDYGGRVFKIQKKGAVIKLLRAMFGTSRIKIEEGEKRRDYYKIVSERPFKTELKWRSELDTEPENMFRPTPTR